MKPLTRFFHPRPLPQHSAFRHGDDVGGVPAQWAVCEAAAARRRHRAGAESGGTGGTGKEVLNTFEGRWNLGSTWIPVRSMRSWCPQNGFFTSIGQTGDTQNGENLGLMAVMALDICVVMLYRSSVHFLSTALEPESNRVMPFYWGSSSVFVAGFAMQWNCLMFWNTR